MNDNISEVISLQWKIIEYGKKIFNCAFFIYIFKYYLCNKIDFVL